MIRRLTLSAIILIQGLGTAAADDRLAVLEFFGRPDGAFCSAAGPAMISLQNEFEGIAVLLEYDYDVYSRSAVVDRFWLTGVQAPYLPLVMVGSGFLTTSGPEMNYRQAYRDLLTAEAARTPRARIEAWWWRIGDSIRCASTFRNTSGEPLLRQHGARAWHIAFEASPIGVSNTWVRQAVAEDLAADVLPGEIATVATTLIDVPMNDWEDARVLVLIEDRPAGTSGRYDMAQAVLARPASLELDPADGLLLSSPAATAELSINGPPVLQWTAEPDADWLEVEPAAGTVPGTVTVAYRPELRPPGAREAGIVVHAAGDTLVFDATVEVAIGGAARHSGRRVTP